MAISKDTSTKNMTTGTPWKLILGFALPLMLGNVFQQLYVFTDTMVIGNALGVTALAALGSTEWLIFMVFGFIQGLTHGISIKLSHKFGDKDYIGLKKAYINAVYIIIASSVLFTALGQIIIVPILRLINAPSEIIGMSGLYLKTLFLGIPIVIAYNFFSAVLRSLGNSKTPLHAMAIASIINIILDVVFVFVFKWGILGVAVATLLAQAFAAIFCIYSIGKIEILKHFHNEKKLDVSICLEQIKLGLPMGLLNVVTATGGLIVQSIINGFGVIFIAGFTAATKLYILLEIAASSYGYAISTYTGQNYGARLVGRIKRGVRSANLIGVLTAIAMSAIMIFLGKPILGLFVKGEAQVVFETISIGYQFLTILAMFFPLLYILYIMRSCLQGMGRTISPIISSIAQLVMRVACAVILTSFIGEQGVFWGEIFAWVGADSILIFSYFRFIGKIK